MELTDPIVTAEHQHERDNAGPFGRDAAKQNQRLRAKLAAAWADSTVVDAALDDYHVTGFDKRAIARLALAIDNTPARQLGEVHCLCIALLTGPIEAMMNYLREQDDLPADDNDNNPF